MTGSTANSSSLLRAREGHTRVTYVELFFDLVFVFAVTQLSHHLLHDLTWTGFAETVFLALAVWCVWIYTAWTTNWLDPQSTLVRILLFALMAGGLVMSSSIPQAFESKGLAFAGAYAAMQLGRTVFITQALRGRDPVNHRNFQRITVWVAFSSILWIAGAFLDGPARWTAWIAALAMEGVSPAVGFWVPGMGRSSTTDWKISADHFAERCALFVIIALGESLLVTGATFAEQPLKDFSAAIGPILAFAAALLGAVAMWWVYFSVAAEDTAKEFERAADPGRIARIAYTYFHLPLIGGIILAAVGDELMLAHPFGFTDPLAAVCILGGPMLFLAGNLLFKRVLFEEFLRSHIAGLAMMAGLSIISTMASPIILSAVATTILFVTGVWENNYAKEWKHLHPEWRSGKKN